MLSHGQVSYLATEGSYLKNLPVISYLRALSHTRARRRLEADGAADLRLVRVLPIPAGAAAEAGPLVCSPTRAGLTVPIHAWRLTEPDASLH